MAIRYDKSYNAEIRKVVRNFNLKRNRAIKRGFKNVPAPIKVSDLKARYTTRKLLNEQLQLLSDFSSGRNKVLQKIETTGGATAIEWEFDYLKSNEREARKYLQREYERVSRRVGEFPGERMQLDAIKKKIDTLDMNIMYMDQSQFNTYRSAIREYINKPKKQEAGYRGFLKEVDLVMSLVGIDEKTKNRFFDKFKVLNPEEFYRLYNFSDLVSRIYELADSPVYSGSIKMNASEEDARDLIETLIEETDDLISDVKQGKI